MTEATTTLTRAEGVAEINASPVVFRWNKFDLGVA